MSSQTRTPVTCPDCGHTQEFVAWRSLNVTLDPDEKPRLLDGSLTRFECGRCGKTSNVVYPLLYHDMQRQLMLWLLPKEPGGADAPGDEPEDLAEPMRRSLGKQYVCRRVDDPNELKEKIYIFDHGMDDRVVEVVKLMLWHKMPEEKRPAGTRLLFTELESDEGGERLLFTILTPGGTSGVSVPREPMYTKCREKYAGGRVEDGWPRVDREFAFRLIEGSANRPGPPHRGAGSPGGGPTAGRPRRWWQFWR